MKNITLLLLMALLTLNAFTQETKYVVFDNPHDGTCQAFEVKTKIIQSHRYELKDLDNPEYLMIKSQIDSLENVEKNITSIPDILDTEAKSNLKQAKDFLEQAIDAERNAELSFFGISILSGKKKYLTSAKEYLIKTDFEFDQDVKGRNAIKQAKSNIIKIDGLVNRSSRKESEIRSNLHTKISGLKREIGLGGHPRTSITKKISKYVPVEEIEREILFVDTTVNVGDKLEGTFIPHDNFSSVNYVLMQNNFNQFI